MDIVVCVKRVPDTSEADVIISGNGQSIDEKNLVFGINDWDRYAVEEAVLLKEKFGGSVTVVTVGPEETEDTLRRCLATGVDTATRVTDKVFEGSDAVAIARILHRVIKGLHFDMIFTGAQTSDDGYGQVGPTLAEFLAIPCATLVTNIEIENTQARVHRELEGGLEEVVEVQLPAVFTIQTGINEPRYVSIMGVRKAAQKEMKVLDMKALGFEKTEIGNNSSLTKIERLFSPPVTKETEILQGNPEEVAKKFARILKDKGVLV
ncbi:electron transfer flavoprotein subunit beta/FixA family protein [Chloroflexota bacterium]